jgi:hypothetical protein
MRKVQFMAHCVMVLVVLAALFMTRMVYSLLCTPRQDGGHEGNVPLVWCVLQHGSAQVVFEATETSWRKRLCSYLVATKWSFWPIEALRIPS